MSEDWDKQQKDFVDALYRYSQEAPSAQNAVDIFRGYWSSKLPPVADVVTGGYAPLFRDQRVFWAEDCLHGYAGMRVLELGPLEGMHSYLLEQRGAQHVTAIEANPMAYLRCLIAKEILQLQRCQFLFGDFNAYLAATDCPRYDLVFASGVFYHMREPWELLQQMAAVTDRIYLWTHYYDEQKIAANERLQGRFGAVEEREALGLPIRFATQYYQGAHTNVAGFCGGGDADSTWMERGSILALLQHLGFDDLRVGMDEPEHPNGPAFALVAQRHI